MKTCAICGKKPVSAYNRPHSLHKTKTLKKPNIQKVSGLWVCTACMRSLDKVSCDCGCE